MFVVVVLCVFLTSWVCLWIASPLVVVRNSCAAPVVPSRLNHGAEETFLAQKGVREEGRQEEVPPLVEAPQREEGQLQASLPQAQVEEGR